MQGKTFQPAIGEEILIPAQTSHAVRNIVAARRAMALRI